MLCLADFEEFASQSLGKAVWDFFRNGAERETTLRENTRAFERYYIVPRMLRNVASRDLSVTVLGQRLDFPVGLAPTAFQKLAHPEGEVAAARAAASMGTVYTMSTMSNTSAEELAREVPGGLHWQQLYVSRDRSVTTRLVQNAERAGFRALVLTVDTPVDALRLPQRRTPLVLPPHLGMPNLGPNTSPAPGVSPHNIDSELTWDDVDWLRSISKLPIVLKGILSEEDAKLAVKHGASAVWVSNHGGRQLDGTFATIDALGPVVDAVRGTSCEVYMDSGIRWGSDVFKALRLGARAVFVGRPLIWGLTHSGEEGVRRVLTLLKEELNLTMALAGCRNYEDLKSVEMVRRDLSKL